MADTFFFAASLNGASEAPVPIVSDGTGSAFLTFDTDLNTMRIQMEFQDLEGTTFASHVHAPTAVPRTGLAGVATELPSFTGFPLGVTAGTYDHVFDTSLLSTWNPTFTAAHGGTAAGAAAAFLTALQDGKAYINIHTTFATSGEIRGFFDAVPEPSSWALMLAGFGLAGAALRARRRAPLGM
jgi:hypothetical protein